MKKVLFIGGYGNISWWCTKLAIEKGFDVYLLNRDLQSGTRRDIPKEAKIIKADYRNQEETKTVLKDYEFDVVCDFICYNKEQAENAVEVFSEKTKQYIVLSSGANYDRTIAKIPLTEDSIQRGTFPYVKNKIEMETMFLKEYKRNKFPITIVRPGQTYDTLVPDCVGNADFTNIQRMIDRKPIIILGEGTTPWALIHSSDFAQLYIPLIGNKKAIGNSYHIAGDEILTWNQIVDLTAHALSVKAKKVYMTSEFIKKFELELAEGLKSHKIYADIYDNSKIKELNPNYKQKILFKDGIKMSIDWLLENPKHQRINLELDKKIDKLICKLNSIQ